jgi:hypothetical protein
MNLLPQTKQQGKMQNYAHRNSDSFYKKEHERPKVTKIFVAPKNNRPDIQLSIMK